MNNPHAISRSRQGWFGLSIIVSVCVALGTGLNTAAADDPCEPHWLNTIGQPWMNESAEAMAVFDDGSGSGPALFVGGEFTSMSGMEVSYIAKWDGTPDGVSALGSGMNGPVYALTVFDDGSGPALYAGGEFTSAGGVTANRIAKWNGLQWSALGDGMDHSLTLPSRVSSLTVFDDASGPALYAGGNFLKAGRVWSFRIAKWDGQQWSALGSGMSGTFGIATMVTALTVYDEGSGPSLYAGGKFTTAGGIAANYIAKWDGQQWSALASGIGGPAETTSSYALTVFDDGAGPALYAAGQFNSAGGVSSNNIAKWDGEQWTPLGSGGYGWVSSLIAFDDGSGQALYASGSFTAADDEQVSPIAKWDGQEWSAVGSDWDPAIASYPGYRALTVFDDGSGPALFGGGGVVWGSELVWGYYISKWDGQQWSSLSGNGIDTVSLGDATSVTSFAVFDDGTGTALYAGGYFHAAGGVILSHIAKWGGPTDGWSALGSGMVGNTPVSIPLVRALTVFDDGTGPALYAGGIFTMAGGATANGMAKWEGNEWSALNGWMSGAVYALTVFDDGSGPALYVGGISITAGGVASQIIVKWDGTQWSALGSGPNSLGAWVDSLTAFDDGTGPALYAGGHFTMAGGVEANHIAKWDGQVWSALGLGMDVSTGSASVSALIAFDDDSGSALYAGGKFDTAGGVNVNNLANWNGQEWSALGGGLNLSSSIVASVYDLSVFDDGNGPALYAGGSFATAVNPPSSVTVNQIAKWNGEQWSALGSGMSGINSAQLPGGPLIPNVYALTIFDYGSGPALYAGGEFIAAGGSPAHFIANWGGCAIAIAGDFDEDGDVDGMDFTTFTQCLAGPAVPPAGTCPVDIDADLDVDGDVDLRDFADFQGYFTGP